MPASVISGVDFSGGASKLPPQKSPPQKRIPGSRIFGVDFSGGARNLPPQKSPPQKSPPQKMWGGKNFVKKNGVDFSGGDIEDLAATPPVYTPLLRSFDMQNCQSGDHFFS